MKSLVELLDCVASDIEATLGVNLRRDVLTIRRRVEHEGDSFLTITLPAFCQDFEMGLDRGRVGPEMWASFKKLPSGIPAFLQGLLSNVFDPAGELRVYPSIDCIRAVRQLCLFCKKVERECSDARRKAAVEGFAQCDTEIAPPDGQLWRYFGLVADIIVGDLPGVAWVGDNVIDLLRPKHGPGGTREGILGNQKWAFRRWHERLEASGFTWRRFARAQRDLPSSDEDYVAPDLVSPELEEPVRVVLVPKTLKAPRVIAIEPVCMQYAQQGLKQLLVDELGNSSFTKGRVNFTDQGKNQSLALRGSKDGKLATMDLSEASDRVGLWHVERLFAQAPEFLNLVLACRSQRAELPNGEVLSLSKFASMGSALCFPIEALVFFVSIVASRILRAGEFPTAENVHKYGRSSYVYGDDLIVPTDEAPAISDDLELLGFKVNRRKSFWTGKFRESCGLDCYAGEVVKPIYFRRDLPDSRGDISRLLSGVSTANQLFQAGYAKTATAIRKAVERILGQLPQVPPDSPAIGWWFGTDFEPRTRWNRYLQRREIYAWVPDQADKPDSISGDPALAKGLLVAGSSCYEGNPFKRMAATREDHLEVSPRSYALKLKRRWVPAF